MQIEVSIKAIETCKPRHPDWFYHAFFPQTETYTAMLTEGIKCRKLMSHNVEGKKGYTGHNGNHYISLSKMEEVQRHNSSYTYYEDKPALIVDGINPRKCLYSMENGLLEKTRWPIRYSGFEDEYQAYRIIEPDKIIGLRCSILYWYRDSYKFYLAKLKEMILFMKEHNINLPIYDYTRAGKQIHLINPDAYLELYSAIEKSLHEKEVKYLSKN